MTYYFAVHVSEFVQVLGRYVDTLRRGRRGDAGDIHTISLPRARLGAATTARKARFANRGLKLAGD